MKRITILLFMLLSQNLLFSEVLKPSNVPKEAIWIKEADIWYYKKSNNEYFAWKLNGKKYIESIYSNTEKKWKTVYWHENGNIASQGFLYNKKREGQWSEYYDNGKLKWVGLYKNNQLDGDWKLFDSNGEEKGIEKYGNGKLIYRKYIGDPDRPKNVPLEARWISERKIWGVGTFINNKKDGTWIIWNKDGIKKSETEFSNGEMIADKIYDKNGMLSEERKFKDGKKIFEKKY